MNEATRQKYLFIIDDKMDLLPILHQIRNFKSHALIIDYLYQNKIVGEKLLTYYKEQKNSILHLVSDIIRRVNKQNKKQKLFARDLLNGFR